MLGRSTLSNSFKRVVAAVAVTTLASTSLASCSHSDSGVKHNADGAVVLDFWHGSGGVSGKALNKVVDDFNEAHKGEIFVNASYQGGYEDNIAKFIASVQTGDLPALLQANDVQTTFLKESDVMVPAQELNDKYGGYNLDDITPTAANYYTFDDTIHSMPAMMSQTGLYVNDDMLAEAGVSHDDLKTMDGLLDAARKIKAKTGKPGLTFQLDGWYMEQPTAALGENLCSPDNGVKGQPADKFNLTNDKVVDLWKNYGDMFQKGEIHNGGKSGDTVQGAWLASQAAIMIGSSGGLGQITKSDPSFNWSMARMPRENDKAGALPGGNSIWAVDLNHTDEEEKAAWEFMKYIGQPDTQKYIFEETGYLPTNKKTMDMVDDANDNQKVLLDQLDTNPVNTVTAGCHTDALQQARREYEAAMMSIANGADAENTLSQTEDIVNRQVEVFNKRSDVTDLDAYKQ